MGRLGAKRQQRTWKTGAINDFIRDLASRQHNVVALRQLLAEGISEKAVRNRVASGLLHPIHRGVYALGRPDLNHLGTLMAAVLAAGEGSILGEAGAGKVWEVSPLPRGDIAVFGQTHRRGLPGIRVRRIASLEDWEWGTKEGIPVTSLERTLIDIAATSPEKFARRCLEEADRQRILELRRLSRLCDLKKRTPGVPRIRKLIAELGPPSYTRSEFEDDLRDLCRDNGLPLPEPSALADDIRALLAQTTET